MDWLITYSFEGNTRRLSMRSQDIPNIKAIAFKAVMTAYHEEPPIPLDGLALELWMEACGIELLDVTLESPAKRRKSRTNT